MNLKNTVEEQIDIILKLEDQRKALVKENKLYKDKNKELTALVNKYNFATKKDVGVAETQTEQQANHQTTIQDAAIQTQEILQQKEQVSHLQEAKELLNCLNVTQFKNISQKQKLQQSSIQSINTIQQSYISKKSANQDSMLSSEIVKMSKQINGLRKDLKDSLKIIKVKDTEMKQIKRCLELKSQLLQKSRTQFNQLSKIVNTDKYKSVRTLEQQSQKARQNLKTSLEDNKILKNQLQKLTAFSQKLRYTLEKLTLEYENYKDGSSKEKKEQSQTIQTMKQLVQKYKQQAKQYEKNQKHLLESVRRCKCPLQ